eukprot:5842342-Pyramimonas_sp.AAC.1
MGAARPSGTAAETAGAAGSSSRKTATDSDDIDGRPKDPWWEAAATSDPWSSGKDPSQSWRKPGDKDD